MKLIDNWKHGWRMLSVQANVIGTSMIASYMAMPDEWKAQLPVKYVLIAAVAVFVLGTIGRLIDQPKVKK